MIKFYITNLLSIIRFGLFIPFIINSDFRVKISKKARFKMAGRLRIGDKNHPELSLSKTSVVVQSNCTVEIGEGVVFGGGVLIFVKENSNFKIGNNSYITADTRIESVKDVTIGANCAISWGVTIIDDDHHTIMYNSFAPDYKEKTVLIGDKVWVGCNVTILKGTTIGSNCVVAAGSIVKGDFPDNVLIAGNPARVVKENVSWN